MAFIGCRSGANSHKGHDNGAGEHNHTTETTNGHAADSCHDGHNHGAGEDREDHRHDANTDAHDGHNREAADDDKEHNHGTGNDKKEHDHGSVTGAKNGEIVFSAAQADAAGLSVETVGPADFRTAIKTCGTIESPHGEEAVVAATSSGIVSLTGNFTEGTAVAKGQAIVTISAQNLVDGDPAARAKIEYETAGREFRRAETLIKDRIISQKDFDEAQRRFQTARAALPQGAGVSGGVRVASPIGGYVKNRFVGSGEYVAIGQPIATISKTGKLQLRAEVSQRHLAQLPTISGANFRLAAGGKIHSADRLLSYGRAVNGAYIPVVFEFANVGNVLPGAYAEVWLLGAPVPDVLSVPKTAITEEQGLYFVYLRRDALHYAKQEVAIGADNGTRVQITNGLKPGDVVVTHGATQVRLAAMSGVIPEGHSHAH